MAVDASSVTVPRQPGDGDLTSRGPGRGGPLRELARSWALVLSLVPLGLLAVAAWYGQYVRPSADEWCFLPYVRDHGISGLTGKFYFHDNGRIANGWLVGLYAEPGVPGHQWFGLVSGVLMVGLLWAVIALAFRAGRLTVPRGVPLLVASVTAVVFLFATTNTYKTFFWPAASVSHTVAPVLALAAVIPALLARSPRGRIAALVIAVFAGTFLGTLSEETSVVLLVVLSAVVLFAGQVFTADARRHVRHWALATMAGVVIGVLLLVTSPGSRERRQKFGAGTSMVSPDSLTTSLHLYVHIIWTVVSTWQYLGAVAVGLVIGLVARRERSGALLPCRPFLLAGVGALALLVSGFLCTVITYPVFGKHVLTTQRTWNDYLLLYVLLLVGIGALLGRAIRLRPQGALALTAAAGVVCAGVCVSLAVPLHTLGHQMHVRAEKWDRQDQWMRKESAAGAKVLPYKPLHVGKMLEPFGMKPNGWPASCVADYYHVDRVTHAKRLP
ncbi:MULTISPECIES: DUF6056 family protein [unclassified Streptomyces]|uniref:DUF6056 family protein n=1 Tax=unclassified Streptomyces TaxID=2593676 RepID=UPI002E1BD802|nr:DUF6056 family protein [Streptomyces sp. NBC_01023]